VAYTKELHKLREGDELYEPEGNPLFTPKKRTVNTTQSTWEQPGDAPRWKPEPNAATKYHQIPPPWLTIKAEPLEDILQTVTVAPIFREGAVCLARPPPTNRVCLQKNAIIGFAVKFSDGLCRAMRSTTCTVDWDTMLIQPSYKCGKRLEYFDDGEFESGVCGRVVDPQGGRAVLLREAFKRFGADGWSFPSPVALSPLVKKESEVVLMDVEEDPCISDAEGCREQFQQLGSFGAALGGIAAALIVATAGMDVYHDYLIRQITLIDLKELEIQRKVRRAMDADKLRTLEALQYEQSAQMMELEKMGRETELPQQKDKDLMSQMLAPLPPGAVAPV